MAGKSDAFENDLLKLIFNGTPIANIADNAGASPLAYIYVSLHTADPTDAGNQESNEAAYTGYARLAVARTSAGWVVTGSSVSPATNLDFGQCTAGTATITHWGVGTTSTGAGKILYAGTVTPNIAVSSGVIPRLTTSSTITED